MFCTVAALCLFLSPLVAGFDGPAFQKKNKPGPETLRAKARMTAGAAAVGDAYLTIQIDAYTPERDLRAMEEALKSKGSEGFLDALRQAPVAGHLQIGEQKFTIRWARQQPTASGRVISIVTDKPVYFAGGGVPGAKSRAGFEVAVLQLRMDSSGVGEGTMAAAARVKPGGPTGVEVQDYADEPLKLVWVSRVFS